MTTNEQPVSGSEKSIIEHRKRVSQLQVSIKPLNVPFFDEIIKIGKKTSIPIRVYRPEAMGEAFDTIFYLPGNAFVASETAYTELICSYLAEYSTCQVILVQHRLAPENRFPVGLNDAKAIVMGIIEKSLFFAGKGNIAIAGYSSGGNFAASVTLACREKNLPVSQQILISPMLDLSRSQSEFKNYENKDTVITNEFIQWFLNLYLPKGINRQQPELSPFWEKGEKLKKLPVTDIFFGEHDRLRGDCEGYMRKLIEAEVKISRVMLENANHAFLWNNLNVITLIAILARTRLKGATVSSSIVPKTKCSFFRSNHASKEQGSGKKREGKNPTRCKL